MNREAWRVRQVLVEERGDEERQALPQDSRDAPHVQGGKEWEDAPSG